MKVQIKTVMLYFGLIILLVFAMNTSVNASDAINLTNSKEIEDAEKLNKSIDIMSSKVMQCVENKLAPAKKCFCLFPNEFEDFTSTYRDILEKYPQWDDKIVSWKEKDGPMGKNLVFGPLKVQVNMKCE